MQLSKRWLTSSLLSVSTKLALPIALIGLCATTFRATLVIGLRELMPSDTDQSDKRLLATSQAYKEGFMNLQREKMNNKDQAFPISKSPKRAVRRSHTERVKAKTKRMMEAWSCGDMSEAEIGRLSSHHFTVRGNRRPNSFNEIDWRSDYDL